jgi:pimeloyl-ACP methyl ester carboxylesterase
LQPPFVLVGHSLGGLNMQLFARVYQREVKGMMLFDWIYPGAVKKAADFPWTTPVTKRI